MTVTEYALSYIAFGIVALIVCRVINWLRHRNQDRFVSELLAARKSSLGSFRPLDAFKEIGVWGFALLIWPIAVWVVVWDIFAAIKRGNVAYREPDPQDRFYAKDNLTEIVSIDQAESRERIMDPLGRVPPVPFGHLSVGWKRFLARKPSAEAQLWAFHRKTDQKAHWSFDRANGVGRGYCWVLNGKISAEIRIEG